MTPRATSRMLVLAFLAVVGIGEAGDALSVNGITVSTAEVALARYWAKLEAPYQASDDATTTALAVDKVVADLLLAGEANAAGETLGKKEVKEGIAAFRTRVGGEAAYKDVLRVTGASEDDLARLVERHRLARRYIEQHIAPTVSVSEAEARDWYEQPGHQVHDVDAAVDQAPLVGDRVAFVLHVAVHVADLGQPYQHPGAVLVAQAPFHRVPLKQLQRDAVLLLRVPAQLLQQVVVVAGHFVGTVDKKREIGKAGAQGRRPGVRTGAAPGRRSRSRRPLPGSRCA